jgi:hypothetical protein
MELGKFSSTASAPFLKSRYCSVSQTFILFHRDNNANYNGGDWHCDSGCLKNVQSLDILSVHYYGGDFANTMTKSESYAYKAGKAFIVDEFGKL